MGMVEETEIHIDACVWIYLAKDLFFILKNIFQKLSFNDIMTNILCKLLFDSTNVVAFKVKNRTGVILDILHLCTFSPEMEWPTLISQYRNSTGVYYQKSVQFHA